MRLEKLPSHCRSRFILFRLALLSTKYMPNKPWPFFDLGLDLKRLVKNSKTLMRRENSLDIGDENGNQQCAGQSKSGNLWTGDPRRRDRSGAVRRPFYRRGKVKTQGLARDIAGDFFMDAL
jgi:hypothetical protein